MSREFEAVLSSILVELLTEAAKPRKRPRRASPPPAPPPPPRPRAPQRPQKARSVPGVRWVVVPYDMAQNAPVARVVVHHNCDDVHGPLVEVLGWRSEEGRRSVNVYLDELGDAFSYRWELPT